MESEDYKSLNKSQQKQLADWKTAFKPRILALNDTITPYTESFKRVVERFVDIMQKVLNARLKIEDLIIETTDKRIQILKSKPG